jgi:hypothetical protein
MNFGTARVFTYNPGDVNLSVAGFVVQDWDSISLKRSTDAFKMIKGIRGKNTRSRSLDSSIIISIEVGAASMANDVFSEIVRQDLIKGTGRCQIVLKDLSGTTEVHSETGFITDLSEIHFSAEIGTRKWDIACLDSYTINHGGNAKSILNIFNL